MWKIISFIGAGFLAILMLVAAGLGLPASTALAQQATPLPTPTPGPNGRITYIVQEGESAWVIAAKFNIELDELIRLNNLDPQNPIILEGQELLFGLAGPPRTNFTPGPSPTPTALLPTPSPQPGTGTICVLLFEDINGDAFHQEAEVSIPGGAISISNRAGTASETADTVASANPAEPTCFEELPEGDYNVTVAIPEGYNPTSLLNYPLALRAGDETFLSFGAQLSTQALVESPPPAEGGRSPLLGLLGGGLIIVGIGLGIFAGRLRQRPL